jgi:hypothetical protein
MRRVLLLVLVACARRGVSDAAVEGSELIYGRMTVAVPGAWMSEPMNSDASVLMSPDRACALALSGPTAIERALPEELAAFLVEREAGRTLVSAAPPSVQPERTATGLPYVLQERVTRGPDGVLSHAAYALYDVGGAGQFAMLMAEEETAYRAAAVVVLPALRQAKLR